VDGVAMTGNYRSSNAWRDAVGELLGKKKLGARITDDLAEGTVVFSDSCRIADDYIITNVQLNHDKDLVEDISPHLHWFQDSTNIPNWMLQYRWQINGRSKITAWSGLAYESQVYTYASGTMLQITEFPDITPPSGSYLSDIIQFRILRDTNNDSSLFDDLDPYKGSVHTVMFDVHIPLDSNGSIWEFTK
jgi:hypothetical protein